MSLRQRGAHDHGWTYLAGRLVPLKNRPFVGIGFCPEDMIASQEYEPKTLGSRSVVLALVAMILVVSSRARGVAYRKCSAVPEAVASISDFVDSPIETC